MGEPDMCPLRGLVSDIVPTAVARFGAAVALFLPDGDTVSFDQLHDMSARFAGGLMRCGLRPDDHVVLHLPSSAAAPALNRSNQSSVCSCDAVYRSSISEAGE